METTVKTEEPKKKKVVKGERKLVDSPLLRLRGLLKGKIFYESDDIFYQYRLTQ